MAQSATVTVARSPVGIPFLGKWHGTPSRMTHMGCNPQTGNNGQRLHQRWLPSKATARNKRPHLPNRTQYWTPYRERNTGTTQRARPKKWQRKVDCENECKQIAFKGPIVDGIPWDEADIKIRSLIYLSLGTEGQRIYQQRFPHSDIERIKVFELAHELSLSFTQPRKITYDHFLLFTCKQKQNEKLESFHCRLRALGAKCRLGTAEEDLIKDILIAFMTNTKIQRELLMETWTSHQVLQFALSRERGQENQKAIKTQLNRNPLNAFDQISHITHNQRNQTYNQISRPRTPIRNSLPQRNTNTMNPCRRCGIQLTLEHLLICPAKKLQCDPCKKIGHYSKVCRSAKLIWQTQQIRPQQDVNQQNIPQTRRVRNIRTTKPDQQYPTHNQDTQSDNNDKTIDLENIFFLQEVFDS